MKWAILSAWNFLARLFTRPHPADPTVMSASEAPDAQELRSEFRFKKALLEHLDSYFIFVRRMKKCDPAGYAEYSRIGAQIIAPSTLTYGGNIRHLSAWWKAGNRPSFGAIAPFLSLQEDNSLFKRFAYFQKFDTAPAHVQRNASEVVYRIVGYYDDDKRKFRHGASLEYYVGIDPSCTVRVLKQLTFSTRVVWSKRRRSSFIIPQRKWDYPEWLRDNAEEHKNSIQVHGALLFGTLASYFDAAQLSVVRVAATKGDLTAVFSVDLKRTPYFFADRERLGPRKKIFHVVRAHARVTATGNETAVRLHFRGERNFTWRGYRIHITVPGRHHKPLTELQYGAVELGNDPVPPRMVTVERANRVMADHIEAA